MILTERSGLTAVALAVGDALRGHGIRAVLTGGACAALHSGGAYHSSDVDLILMGPATQGGIDRAMSTVGFRREGDRYTHPRARFYVEFPRGPLAIGDDYRIRPVERKGRGGRILLLSATDSCRDRLAGFYHWRDRQSLRVAVWIAMRNRVHLGTVRRWSDAEGFADGFAEFAVELRRARAAARSRRAGRRAAGRG